MITNGKKHVLLLVLLGLATHAVPMAAPAPLIFTDDERAELRSLLQRRKESSNLEKVSSIAGAVISSVAALVVVGAGILMARKMYASLLEEITPVSSYDTTIPDETLQVIKQRLSGNMVSADAYRQVIKTYPWKKTITPPINLEHAREVLKKSHYGMDLVKERIVAALATRAINQEAKVRPICLVGSPGTGKTSIVQALADATARKFYKIDVASSGGSSEPVYLKGSSSVYIGAMPGEFTNALCRTQASNPLVLLDEIDKASATSVPVLLEALDPENNKKFLDTFMGFGIDLSDVFFVATANNIASIPSALRDRMDIVFIDQYSTQEQIEIAQNYTIPRAIKGYDLPEAVIAQLTAAVPRVVDIVAKRNPHGGMRQIDGALKCLIAKEVTALLETGQTFEITPENVEEYLDPVYRRYTLGEPHDVRVYCNNILKDLPISPEVFKKIENRIQSLSIWRASDSLIPVYMDWVSKYPFDKVTDMKEMSLKEAREHLDSTHIGMKQVKNNIINYLASLKMSNERLPKSLCLYGAPGLGKTTIAQSIAQALGKKSTIVSLDGLLSIDAKNSSVGGDGPGKLAEALCNAGCLDPVIILDEMDKATPQVLMRLVEILDPSRNQSVLDEFMGFDIDLSKVTFIVTANDIGQIPWPLRDRMFMLKLGAYTRTERIQIARQMIVPSLVKKMNLPEEVEDRMMALIEPMVRELMDMEAGVRTLTKLLQLAAEQFACIVIESNEMNISYLSKLSDVSAESIIGSINPELLHEIPGRIPEKEDQVGIVHGMVATSIGTGGVAKILAGVIPYGKGALEHSKLVGETESESHTQTLAYVKKVAVEYGINPEVFGNHTFMFRDQSYNKSDGPSAGVAQTVALISALTNRKVRCDYAMTGAIDLYGNVLEVGGYRGKILGTRRSGIKKFLVPIGAKPVIEQLREDLGDDIEITFISHVKEALDLVLHKE